MLVDRLAKAAAGKPAKAKGKSDADKAFDALAKALEIPKEKHGEAKDALAYYILCTED